jgi:hypothetical protein
VIIPINVINRDKSIWGEDAAEFKLFFFVLVLIWLSDEFFFLDPSVGKIFRILPLLFLESGRTY